ncbi:Flp pilus assembly protein CpaB [Pelagibius marinus]|uniref:Flp pilus assembly protein CpaB n=1 Tax=Pelagibius marinus TaxID=2762760 RepID=UPI0018725FF0|nr:Flp pilus assembly protein CpaB [Pelagibius marinus]
MSLRNIILIAAALLITVVTTFVARSWLESQRAQPVAVAQQAPAPKGVMVLVAKISLPTGVFIQEDQLRWQNWPDDEIPEEYITDEEFKIDAFYGAVVRRGFTAGEPITPKRVIRPGERGFLAAVLRPGYRAMAIRVNATSGVSGLVFPGDRIDIILTHTIVDRTGAEAVERRASETVLENVRVLAIDQTVDEDKNEPSYAKNFTLEVTPKQTEMLTVVRELGILSISLRSLAKDEEELERLTSSQEESLEEPDPERGHTYTWDTEVSRLVGMRSGQQGGNKKVVNITRGNEVQEQRF